MTTFLALVFMAVAILIVLVVLVQRGRGGGLAGAFGSGGGTSSAFGTKTGDVFTTMTVVLFVVFMLLAIWLNFRFQEYKEAPAFGQSTTAPAGAEASTTQGAADGSMTPPGGTVNPEVPAAPAASQPK